MCGNVRVQLKKLNVAEVLKNHAGMHCAKQKLAPIGPCKHAPTLYYCKWQLTYVPPTPAPTSHKKSRKQLLLDLQHANWRRDFTEQLPMRGSCVNWLMSFDCLGKQATECERHLNIQGGDNYVRRHGMRKVVDGPSWFVHTRTHDLLLSLAPT